MTKLKMLGRTFAAVLLVVLGATVAPAESSDSANGSFVHYESFPSSRVEPRPVDVWLPPGYTGSGERYPVVYMHDGQMVFDKPTSPFTSLWRRIMGWYYGGIFWDVDKTMARLIREEKIRSAIVVSIWNSPGVKRRNEYMPQKPVTEEVSRLIKAEGADIARDEITSDNYLKFLVEELKPFIDATYRTKSDRENTFIMGSSMGGMISAYAISEYPDVFGGAGCLSTHWPLGDGAVIDWYENHWPQPGTNRVYFDYGTESLDAEYEPYQLKMDALMRKKGFVEGDDWMTQRFEGEDHSPRAWRERLHIPLTFLLGKSE